jgi:uncharacterized protein (DUF697 family)
MTPGVITTRKERHPATAPDAALPGRGVTEARGDSMDKDQEADRGSRLLRAIQAVAISKRDADALVRKYEAAARKSDPTIDEAKLRQAVGKKIVSRYARLAATAGGVTSLAGVVPGVGTVAALTAGGLADATVSMKLQVDMTMCLASAYGWDLDDEDAKHLTLLIAASGALEKVGGDAAVRVASKAGVTMIRQYLRGSALVAVKELFKRVGITFTRAALQKAIPFGVGVAISSTVNYGLTRFVGAAALSWFALDHEAGNRPVADKAAETPTGQADAAAAEPDGPVIDGDAVVAEGAA